jgi:uroporphyrinogen decarboxylase
VDVLDPVQVRARGMEPAGLKRDFGGRIAFCGGVDLQQLLSRGTPAQVRQGVKDLLRAMKAPQGGFILGPTHNLQMDCAIANIEAMYGTDSNQ